MLYTNQSKLPELSSNVPSCILLSLVSKSLKTFNASQIIADLSEKAQGFQSIEFTENQKCKSTFFYHIELNKTLAQLLEELNIHQVSTSKNPFKNFVSRPKILFLDLRKCQR